MYYLFIIVLLFVAELFYFRLADRFNIIDKPNERSSHTRITLRGGGIVFYFGALCFFFLNGFPSGNGELFEYPWFMLALTLIVTISFIDDIHSTPQWLRLIIHFTAMTLLFYQCGILELSGWWITIALIICTGIINAYNFMDGINGITGGYSLVVLSALAYINYNVTHFVDSSLIYTVLCAVMVFNFFNFRKKAKCFAGDAGSIGIAFIILFLLGSLMVKTKDISWIILLVIYGVDSVLTIVHRILLHENIGLPHRKHLYQIMANELKIHHTVVSLTYMGIQSVIILGYLGARGLLDKNTAATVVMESIPTGYIYLLFVVLFLCILYILFMKKYFRLHLSK